MRFHLRFLMYLTLKTSTNITGFQTCKLYIYILNYVRRFYKKFLFWRLWLESCLIYFFLFCREKWCRSTGCRPDSISSLRYHLSRLTNQASWYPQVMFTLVSSQTLFVTFRSLIFVCPRFTNNIIVWLPCSL